MDENVVFVMNDMEYASDNYYNKHTYTLLW